MRLAQRGVTDQARGRGAGGGEDNLDISFSLSLFICVIQSPPRAGRGAAELSGRLLPLRQSVKGATDQARGRGVGGGEDNLDIFFSLSLFLYPIFYCSIFGIK